MTGDYVMYAQGLVVASVCTSLPDDELLRRANTLDHPGTTNGWQGAEDETFSGGQPNPCSCERNPATHRHVLLEC